MSKFKKQLLTALKKILTFFGIEANLKKNLWYLDPFQILSNLNKAHSPIIFDVGACNGSSITKFRLIFPTAKMHCFEPFPASFLDMKNRVKGIPDLFLVNVALSNTDGFAKFNVNESVATNSLLESLKTDSSIDGLVQTKEKIEVVTQKLDTYVKQNNIDKIDILKLDVQGAELMILQGATETLERKIIKVIYCEVWFTQAYKDAPLYHIIANYLERYEYKSFGIYNMHYRKDGQFLWGDAIFILNDLYLE